VISTSALELGMDIPSLETAVLIGVPRSATSLLQRIGRIGRQGPGMVLVLNTGTVYDEAVFKQPETFLDRPLAEGALYLENSRIQYIHALCLARNGGEHDQVASLVRNREDSEFESGVSWPEGFIDLCKRERRGEVATDLQSMKSESGDDPNHIFPLRDVESSFKVEFKKGPEQRKLGTLNYGQLMREAYPGAVYYYAARPYRIFKVNVHNKVAQARHERGYTSKAQNLPTLVFPNLTVGNVFRGITCGELSAAECNLQVREQICGYKERRGPNELSYNYPIAIDGIYFNQPRFTRNYFTTGVVLTHPALNGSKVNCDLLAELLFEGFLMTIPFERRDIAVAVDKHRVNRSPISEGQRFIALYDQTYGSLRLSGRILDANTIRQVIDQTTILLNNQEMEGAAAETLAALQAISKCFDKELGEFSFGGEGIAEVPASLVQVILPGSRGVNVRRNNEEFEVEHVFFSPQIGGLAYRGRYASTTGDTAKDIIPIDFLAEVPGESKIGQYNLNTGEIEEFNLL
jgi:DEAD/DEAH box helicase domain-containing protein